MFALLNYDFTYQHGKSNVLWRQERWDGNIMTPSLLSERLRAIFIEGDEDVLRSLFGITSGHYVSEQPAGTLGAQSALIPNVLPRRCRSVNNMANTTTPPHSAQTQEESSQQVNMLQLQII